MLTFFFFTVVFWLPQAKSLTRFFALFFPTLVFIHLRYEENGGNNNDENEAARDDCNRTGSLNSSLFRQGLENATDLENSKF